MRISQLSPEEQVSDFKHIMSNNPMSLVLLFYMYAGITKLDNTRICKHLRGIGKKPPEQFKVVQNLCDTMSEAHDSRRLFLAYLHFLYESSRTDLLTKPSNTDQDKDIDFFALHLSGTGLLFMISTSYFI